MDELRRAREEGTYGKTEADELPLIRRGSFKVAYNHEMVFLIIAAVLAIGTFIAFFPVMQAADDAIESSSRGGNFVVEGILLAIAAVFSTIFAIILMGRNCEFSAEETEFAVKGPGNKTEYFYYSDVQNIDFKPFHLFGKDRGHIVTVTTSVRVIEYRVVFGENKIIKDISGNPFYYLGVNSNIITTEKPQIDTDIAESVFESMVVEQITRKSYEELEKTHSTTGGIKW